MRKFVFVAALAILAWIFVAPSCGAEFGCEAAAGAVAHAEDGECPSGLEKAADDGQWAAARYETIKDAKITTGLFYDEDGTEQRYVSGYDEDAERAEEALREAGVPFPDAGPHPAATHVETKIAAIMRENDITYGLIVINHPNGPCGADEPSAKPFSCADAVPAILPEVSTLAIWSPRDWNQSVKMSGRAQ